jgi:hypothetical protein
MGTWDQRPRQQRKDQPFALTCPRYPLWQNPRDSTLSLNCFGVGVVLGGHSATPVACFCTTCVLDCAAHRTRDRDIYAAVARSAIPRRVARHGPRGYPHCDQSNENDGRYQHGTAFARRQRVGRWGLSCVDRRRLLPSGELDRSTIEAALLARRAPDVVDRRQGDIMNVCGSIPFVSRSSVGRNAPKLSGEMLQPGHVSALKTR